MRSRDMQFILTGRSTRSCGSRSCLLQADALVQVVVGTKSGDLLLYNVASAEIIDTIKAHSSTIWSLHVRPDFGRLVSGSADKDVKFWDIEEVENSEVSIKHTLPMDSPQTTSLETQATLPRSRQDLEDDR